MSKSKGSKSSSNSGINLEKSLPSGNQSSPASSAGIGYETEVGEFEGRKISISQEVDLKLLVPAGKIDVAASQNTDGSTNLDLGIGGRVQTPGGAFGVSIGGSIRRTTDGKIEADKGNVSVSAFGVSVSTSVDREGRQSGAICYEYGIVKSCVEIAPQDDKPYTPSLPPIPAPNTENGIELGDGSDVIYCIVKTLFSGDFVDKDGSGNPLYTTTDRAEHSVSASGIPDIVLPYAGRIPFEVHDDFVTTKTVVAADGRELAPGITSAKIVTRGINGKIEKGRAHLSLIHGTQLLAQNTYNYKYTFEETINDDIPGSSNFTRYGAETQIPYVFYGTRTDINTYLKSLNKNAFQVTSSGTRIRKYIVVQVIPLGAVPPKATPPTIPNPPQRKHPMNCCDKIEEIYKYLGIEKLKRNKFPVSNAFLVPDGKGEQKCLDYYEITQALFRMLANGLIINPVTKPLGSEWKNVNATAWASQIYEMAAESMSDGNSTQKFEIAAIMQLVQTMSAVAELSRKVDFISEVLGHLPDLDTEDLPVCFTIHEAHKGFEKKSPKTIDVTEAKTDDEVEKVLAKMLKPSKIPIVKWQFKPDGISIAAALSRL